jgi:hypothetical protein
MKKRKILLGLALAAAAVFSLSACGEDKPADPTPTTEGGEGTTPDTKPDGDEGTGGGTVTPTTQKYDVKFMNGSTELTDLKQSVEKDGKVTKPAKDKLPTQTGKRFDFWSADGGVTAYNFDDPVTSAVQLDAVFVDANEYDTLAASANKIVDYTFYNDTVATVETASFDAEAATINTTNAANKVTNDGKYHIEKDNLNIVLGDKKITSTGVLTVYFEVSFDAIKNGEAFFQIDGTSTANPSATEVFGIRVVGGSDAATKGKFGYRLDGGSDNASTVGPVVNTTYKIKVVLDTADGKASYSVDGVTMAEDINVSINSIRGLKFTAKADAASKKNVDNIVATFEAKAADPVVTAKAAAITELDGKTLSTNDAIKAAEEAKIAEAKTEISAATTVDAVNTAKQTALDYINATKYTLTVKAYTAADTAAADTTDVVKVYLATDSVSLTDVAFSGFNVSKIYTDATLSTEFTATAISTDTVVYAKVASSAAIALDLASILGSETSVTIDKGTTKQDIFTFYGKDVADSDTDNLSKRNVVVKTDATYGTRVELTGGSSVAYKNGELQAMPANCIGVTCATAGTIKVTIQNKVASTEANYTGKDCQVVVLQRVVDGSTVSEKKTKITGKMAASDQQPTEYTITIAEAGTYYIGFSHNGGYIYGISFQA